MKILAIDSTAAVGSVALCNDSNLLALYTINNGNTHSETLLPMIESVLKQAKLTTDDIELYATSIGPGSFTGVRIGCATIKGLAFGKNTPCVGVSSLETLAMNLKGCSGIICPVINARRNQVYNALFKFEDENLTRICDDRIIMISDLAKELSSKYFTDKIFVCGDAYENTLNSIENQNIGKTATFMRLPNAYSVALCAWEKYKNGNSVNDIDIVPTYLRPSQAERERLERLGRESLN